MVFFLFANTVLKLMFQLNNKKKRVTHNIYMTYKLKIVKCIFTIKHVSSGKITVFVAFG